MWIATILLPRCSRARSRWKRRPVIECDQCGARFEVLWQKRHRRFCSTACSRLHPPSEATRAAFSERTTARNLARWSKPEERAKQSAAIAATHVDPDLRSRRREAIRASMATPSFKRKRSLISKLLVSAVRETNRTNGNVRESRGERELVAWLRVTLGDDAVIHHPERVQGADIDVYVRTGDVYIQFDGIYYHGLDRPYEQLSPVIRRKFDRDRAVDALFRRLGLRLVRITDKAWASLTKGNDRLRWLREEVLQDASRREPNS